MKKKKQYLYIYYYKYKNKKKRCIHPCNICQGSGQGTLFVASLRSQRGVDAAEFG